MQKDGFLSYRDGDGFHTIAVPHPVQAKIGEQDGRWRLWTGYVKIVNGQEYIHWRRYPHPFASRGDAVSVAKDLLPAGIEKYLNNRPRPVKELAFDGSMTRQQALEILGLQDGATDEQIRQRHRSLCKALHPDLGGSNFLLTQVNEAARILLPKK